MNEEPVEFAVLFQQWSELILIWVGFGTLTGLLAKAIMPGKDPGGAIATLAMGVGGTIIGCGILSYFYPEERITPISPMGFVVATGGAFVILFFYRLLSGHIVDEAGAPGVRRPYFSRRRRRDYAHED